jgi:hypothetical protein
MARPRVADEGDGLQIWRAAANILSKQSRAVDNRWSSRLGVGRGLKSPNRDRAACYEVLCSSETSVDFYQTTWCHFPDDSTLQSHRRENLSSDCVLVSGRPEISGISLYLAIHRMWFFN